MEQKQQKPQEDIRRMRSDYKALLSGLSGIGALFVLISYSVTAFRGIILRQELPPSNFIVAIILMLTGLILMSAYLIALKWLPMPTTKKQFASYALWWGAFLSILTGALACICTINGNAVLAIAAWILTSIISIFNVLMFQMSM